MNCCTLSVPYFLADSSPFIILPGISAPAAMYHATPWNGSPWSCKLPISPAICCLSLLVSQGVDSLWVESVFKLILFSNSFLRLASIGEFRMKSFSASIEVLYPLLIGQPVTLTSLVMVSSVSKFPGIVESLFPLRLAPRPKVSKSEKSCGFVIDKIASSTWCCVRYRV